MLIIFLLIGVVLGAVGMYFILKKNPNWIKLEDVSKLAKDKLEQLKAKVEEALKSK